MIPRQPVAATRRTRRRFAPLVLVALVLAAFVRPRSAAEPRGAHGVAGPWSVERVRDAPPIPKLREWVRIGPRLPAHTRNPFTRRRATATPVRVGVSGDERLDARRMDAAMGDTTPPALALIGLASDDEGNRRRTAIISVGRDPVFASVGDDVADVYVVVTIDEQSVELRHKIHGGARRLVLR